MTLSRLLVLALLAASDSTGCSTQPPPAVPPGTGTITVGVSSKGPGVERLSFDLTVAGQNYAVRADNGIVTVKSDAVRQVLEWYKKLVPFLPPDVFA